MRKIRITGVLLIIALLVLGACAPPAAPSPLPAPAPAPAPPATPSPKPKLTVYDAPALLDFSTLLPASFKRLDASSEGMSKKELGLGHDYGEVQLYLSEEPYQLIISYFGFIKGQVGRSMTDALLRNEEEVKATIRRNLEQGLLREGLDPSYVTATQISLSNVGVGDVSLLGEGYVDYYGVQLGYDLLAFRRGDVFVNLETFYFGSRLSSLVPLGQLVDKRLSSYSID